MDNVIKFSFNINVSNQMTLIDSPLFFSLFSNGNLRQS